MIFNDSWTGEDKVQHLGGYAAVGLFATLAFGDIFEGFAFATALNLFKEVVWDGFMKKGTSSFQDLVVSEIGLVLGCGAAYYLLSRI